MEVSIFIPLMVAAIQSAGQVLSSVATKVKDVANKHIFDKTFVEDIVSKSHVQLTNLLKTVASDIKLEMREQSITDAIQDLQADVLVLRRLLDLSSTSELSPAIAESLITHALIPLQKSLEKAQIRLKQYGRDDMSSYCQIIGSTTLIAGYGFLGQDVPTLRKDLECIINKFQIRLLDEIAEITVQSDKKIPWEKVSYLLTTEGINDLFNLYESATSRTIPSSLVQEESANQDEVKIVSMIQNFYSQRAFCSECKYEVKKEDLYCPNCHSKFNKNIMTY